MSNFWSSLFGGSNSTLSGDIGSTGQAAGYAENLGQQNATAGSKFLQDILSGDATKQMQALAPDVTAARTSAAQSNKTAAEFGGRSGGTAASTAATTDKLHSTITDLVGSLTGGAASNLLSSGQGLVGTGISGFGQQAQLSEDQMRNWEQSILGKSITGGVAAAESMGIGAAAGALPGGGGAGAGAAGALGIGPSAAPRYGGYGQVPEVPNSFFDSLFAPQPAS